MRKWMVRALVFLGLGGMLLVALAYQFWTNPSSVRAQVLRSLEKSFVDVDAGVESARLRLFGGIEVKELRLARRSDLSRADFLHVPSAVIHPDKEQVLEGILRLRKVEVNRPRLRILRESDGRWNLAGLFGPSDPSRRLPTIVVSQGTIVLEDRRAAAGTPPLELCNVNLSIINDPLPVVQFEGSCTCGPFGAVTIRGRGARAGGGAIHVELDAPDLTVGPETAQRIAAYCPDAAVHLRSLQATLGITASIDYDPTASRPLRYDVKAEVRRGTFGHALLPWTLENLNGVLRLIDGKVPEASLTCTAGKTRLALTLKDADVLSGEPLLERAERIDLDVAGLKVDADLFHRLPAALQSYQTDYSPSGLASVHLSLERLSPGVMRQTGVLTAEDMQGQYTLFRYPVQHAKGKVSWKVTTNSRKPDWPGRSDDFVVVDLAAEAGGKPISLRGRIEGERGCPAINLEIRGNDLPLDGRLLAALPPRTEHVARGFAPMGRFDCLVSLRRPRGKTEIARRFLVHLHDCTVCYKVFPLPLEDVSGTLDFRPDGWEFRDFYGRYRGGVIRASGRSSPLPHGSIAQVALAVPEGETGEQIPPPTRVSVSISGENLPIDDGFKKALAPGREALVRAFDAFALTGKLNFDATIDDLPNKPRDIDVTVGIAGCRMAPNFFRYEMEDVAAKVRYASNRVLVTDFHARHRDARLTIKQAVVALPEEGGFCARLDRFEAHPLPLDVELQEALPKPLAILARTLALDRPIHLTTDLVVKQPPGEPLRPIVWWDATLGLKDTTVQAGIEVKNVTGVVNCIGLHNGIQLEDVSGKAFLDRAVVLNQPLRNVLLPLVIQKSSPDVLRLPGINADLFGGRIGGQGRIEFGSNFRYELDLKTTQVQLEQLGKHNFGKSADLSGTATASVYVAGEGMALDGLRGQGVIDVPNGKLYRLPMLLDLLKWLGLRLPDRTAFEQAHAEFRIEGPRLHIGELDLYGSAISVRGSGSMKLDGSDLKLDLNADWGRLMQLLPPGVDLLSREVSNQLLRIKVRGKPGGLKFEQELVPLVSDPLKRAWKGLSKGMKSNPSPTAQR